MKKMLLYVLFALIAIVIISKILSMSVGSFLLLVLCAYLIYKLIKK